MFTGSMVALVTPMFEDGSIDFDSLDNLIEWHINSGTNAIVSMGTTGESATLNFKEHLVVMEFTIAKVKGRLPVIAGTGANSTSEAIELTTEAKNIGANACLLVTPYYNKPNQQGLYLHYKKIADNVSIPQIIYNVPGRTACDILPETIGRLSKLDNIIGVKEATGDLSRVSSIKSAAIENFELYTGDDATAVDFILLGGHGGISVTANIMPKEVSEMYDLAKQGKTKQAQELNVKLMPLHDVLFIDSNPMPVKYALHQMKHIQDGIRLPLTVLSTKLRTELEQVLRNLNVI